MEKYQHILCAVDLTEDNKLIARRAVELAQYYSAKLTLIHVVQDIPVDLGNEFVMPLHQEVGEQLVERAQEVLAALKASIEVSGVSLDITTTVVSGSTKHEIIDFLKMNKVDLVVTGRHGRHGLSRLLGSTASVIVHNAPCDVLTVHIKE